MDFLPRWGKEGGRGCKHSCHVASLLDKRQPGGSRPGEVGDGEDAPCVSSCPLKAFWWLGRVNPLCAEGITVCLCFYSMWALFFLLFPTLHTRTHIEFTNKACLIIPKELNWFTSRLWLIHDSQHWWKVRWLLLTQHGLNSNSCFVFARESVKPRRLSLASVCLS